MASRQIFTNTKICIRYFKCAATAIECVSKREECDHSEPQLVASLIPKTITTSIPFISKKFFSKYTRILNDKAVALNYIKHFDEAIECLQKAIKMNPEYVKAYCNLGDSLNISKKYQEAIEILDKGLKLDPHRLSLLYNKGNAYLHMQKYLFTC